MLIDGVEKRARLGIGCEDGTITICGEPLKVPRTRHGLDAPHFFDLERIFRHGKNDESSDKPGNEDDGDDSE